MALVTQIPAAPLVLGALQPLLPSSPPFSTPTDRGRGTNTGKHISPPTNSLKLPIYALSGC